MKAMVLAAIFLLGACEREIGDDPAPMKEAPLPNATEPAETANEAAPPGNDARAEADPSAIAPRADPGLADMSPSRRRAWEQGYRDCSVGRYEPDPWPEAYRIGCAAAQNAQEE